MRKYIFLLCSIILITMVSCKKVPEDLKNTYSKDNTVLQESLQYKNLAELKQECEEFAGTQYQQLILPENIQFPQEINGSTNLENIKVAVLDISDMTDFSKKANQVNDVIWKQKNLLKSSLIKKENEDGGTMGKGISYNKYTEEGENPTGEWMALYENGLNCVWDYTDEEYDNLCKSTIVDCYDLNTDEYADKVYELEDKKVTLGEEVEFVENTLNSKYAPCIEPNYQYQVSFITVKQLESGKNVLQFFIEKTYKGIWFEGSSEYEPENEKELLQQNYFYGGQEVIVEMMDSKNIKFFREMSAKPVEKDEYKELLSLNSALSIVSKQLADKQDFALDGVALCYTLRIDNPIDQKTHKRLYVPLETAFEDVIFKGCEARPTWIFYQKRKGKAEGRPYSLFVVVDAIDGEFQYYTGNMR